MLSEEDDQSEGRFGEGIEKRNKKIKKNKKKSKSKKADKDHSSKKKRKRYDSSSDSDSSSEFSRKASKRAISPIPEEPIAPSAAAKKTDFFASLLAAENKKGPLGTVHFLGRDKNTVLESTQKGKGDWECPKCSTTNYKHSIQCTKCKAMKRLSEYR